MAGATHAKLELGEDLVELAALLINLSREARPSA